MYKTVEEIEERISDIKHEIQIAHLEGQDMDFVVDCIVEQSLLQQRLFEIYEGELAEHSYSSPPHLF